MWAHIALNLEQDDWWQVKNPLYMQIVAHRFCKFSGKLAET